MLTRLFVQNYALIDELEINLSKGLTIITGETGAGKSILLGALGLVAGNRADTQTLYDKQKKCVVEASFDIRDNQLQIFFSTHELDYERMTTLRREISAEGKSRAFINDTPVTLSVLKELSEQLIDIHSQHQTLTLSGSEFQLSVLDAYAQHQPLLLEYQQKFKRYKTLEKVLNELIEKENNAKKESDFIQFQFDELEEANLQTGELSVLEGELQTLNNAETIKLNLSKAVFGLDGGDQNILSSLNEIKLALTSIARFNIELEDLSTRVNSAYIELKDLCSEIENKEENVVYNPTRIEELTHRLDIIFRLLQKHQVKEIEELITLKTAFNTKLLEFGSLEAEIEKIKKEFTLLEKDIATLAKSISANRVKVIARIENDTAGLLSSLSMPNAQLKIENSINNTFTLSGIDKINFLFSANKGSEFKELNKVASGGELSRLMLSIKSLIAQLTALPTIIFDEIDTGVSGDVADKVGNIMQKISANIQVIAITHLPQIASKGQTHLWVYKEEKNNKTYSNIKKLSTEERIQEIAKMLSTGDPSQAAIKNAEELLMLNS